MEFSWSGIGSEKYFGIERNETDGNILIPKLASGYHYDFSCAPKTYHGEKTLLLGSDSEQKITQWTASFSQQCFHEYKS